MRDLCDELARFGEAVESHTPSVPEAAMATMTQPVLRARRPILIGIAAVVALLVPAVLGIWLAGRSTDQADDPAMASGVETYGYGPGWHMLDPGPLVPREGAAVVWVGDELVVWGGSNHDPATPDAPDRSDGAAYNPEARTWRMMSPSPLPGGRATGVWTGDELLLWMTEDGAGSGTGVRPVRWPGAAWDPESDTWRRLATTPRRLLDNIDSPSAERTVVWTGDEVVAPGLGARYDPTADRWTPGPARPTESTILDVERDGDRLIAVFADDSAPTAIGSTVYSPGDDGWTALRGPVFPDPGDVVAGGWGLALGATSEGVVAANANVGASAGFLGTDANRWSGGHPIPAPLVKATTLTASLGDRVLVLGSWGVNTLTVDGDRWQLVPPATQPVSDLASSGQVAFGWWSSDEAFNFPDAPASYLQLFVPPRSDALAPLGVLPLGSLRLELADEWSVADQQVIGSPEGLERRIVFDVDLDAATCTVESGYYGMGGPDVLAAAAREGGRTTSTVVIDGDRYRAVRLPVDDYEGPASESLGRVVLEQWPVSEVGGSNVLRIECPGREEVDRLLDRLHRSEPAF